MSRHWQRVGKRTLPKIILLFLVLNILFVLVKRHLQWGLGSAQTHYATLPLKNALSTPNIVPKTKKPKVASTEMFQQRKALVDKVCADFHVPGRIDGIFDLPEKGIIYCLVPKAGCTFWKRVFQFLYTKKSHQYASPWNISRFDVHFSIYKNGFHYHAREHNESRYPIRLLVVRDPFSRLIASYLDKIYLPDFWHQDFVKAGHKYIRKNKQNQPDNADFFRDHFNKMASLFEPQILHSYKTQSYVKSVKYLTFADFIKLALKYKEPHWEPVHTVCNPCRFKPTHIGKMETFTPDAKVILEKMELGHMMDDFHKNRRIQEELQSIVDYNFQGWKIYLTSDYLSGYPELAFRLWHTFQWKGYIHPYVEYIVPQNTSEKYVKKDLLRQVFEARKLGLQHPVAMKMAKASFKLKAYRTLYKELFEAVVSEFSKDFSLFGYEKELEKLRKKMFS